MIPRIIIVWIISQWFQLARVSANCAGVEVPNTNHEGFGLGRLVRENCDMTLSLPMFGKVNSLNASVSAGIIMYEVVKHRG